MKFGKSVHELSVALLINFFFNLEDGYWWVAVKLNLRLSEFFKEKTMIIPCFLK